MSEADRRAAARSLAYAPGTVAGLHVALRSRLEAVAERFPLLETKTGERRAPTVFDFTLPPRREGDESDRFPWIALRGREGADSDAAADQNARATFDIEIATHGGKDDADDAYLDLLLIIDAIRMDLGARPVIENTAYEHVGPLTWATPFPQPRPQWLGVVSTIWSLPRPRRTDTEA